MTGLRERLRSLFSRSRDARWALASQVVTSGSNFLTTIIIVRALGLEAFGAFTVCFLLVMITRSFLGGMVLTPMSTIGPKLSKRSLPAYRGFLAANAAIFAVASSLLLMALAVPLGALLNAPWLPALASVTAAANLTASVADFLRRYHFVYEAPARAFMVDAVRFAVQIGGLLAFAALALLSTESALLMLATGGVAGALAGSVGYGAISVGRRLWSAVWPRHWNFIKWMTPNVALEAVQTTGILLIAGALLGEIALGVLRAMQTVANTINLPVNALQQIAPSLAARSLATSGLAGLRGAALRILGAAVSTAAALAIGIIIVGDWIVTVVLAERVEGAFLILALYSGLNVLLAVRFSLATYLQTLERPSLLMLGSIAGALTALVVVGPATSQFGTPGVPIATAATISSAIAVMLLFSIRSDNPRPRLRTR